MPLHPRLTPATVALVKRFETFQPVAEPTSEGGWSIGYGHTLSARDGARVSRADAEALLIYDLDRAARTVEHALFAPVTKQQFEALTALCFNLGERAFLSSSALARVNAGAELDAADEIERWRQAELGAGTQVVDALVRRRAAEKAHFLDRPEGASTWPSGQRRPLPIPGGEIAEPAAEADDASSATLVAANTVQARLRRLIPDEEAPTEAEAVAWEPTPPPFDAPQSPPTTGAAPDARSTPPSRFEPPAVANDDPAVAGPVITEPPRPEREAFERDAARLDPTDAGAALDPAEPAAAEPSDVPAAAAPEKPIFHFEAPRKRPQRPVVGWMRRRRARWSYGLLTLLGVALFLAGVTMMLVDSLGLLNLGVGIAGVLLAVPGLYGLLEAPRARGPGRLGAIPPEPAVAAPATLRPFHPQAGDTR